MYTSTLECFTEKTACTPIHLVFEDTYEQWLKMQDRFTQDWAKTNNFKQKKCVLLPSAEGTVAQVIFLLKNKEDWMTLGALPLQLPEGIYTFENADRTLHTNAYLAWGLGAYQFTRYKKAKRAPAQLSWHTDIHKKEILATLEAIYLTRDLITTPTEDMTPVVLAEITKNLAKKFKGSYKEIVGEALLKENFPCIYHVGRASIHAPRLLELRWGNKAHPKITLVGKGVCFDTGGLNMKTTSGMAQMKKDMGGAAHVLGLAQLIMAQELPLQLRILIPAVENSISGNAYRPGDVLTSRTGKTIEITNTDAEGRLILCDTLAAAAEEAPELLIDFATLTGAARIAVGTELSAIFSNDDGLATQLVALSETIQDPAWRLPLFKNYRHLLDSTIADIANAASGPYAGAITAALFLEEFIPPTQKWMHFDVMAWNIKTRPGKPEGGEAMGLRTLYEILKRDFNA